MPSSQQALEKIRGLTVSALLSLTLLWRTAGCGEANGTENRRHGCRWARCLLPSPLALEVSALQMGKAFFQW